MKVYKKKKDLLCYMLISILNFVNGVNDLLARI